METAKRIAGTVRAMSGVLGFDPQVWTTDSADGAAYEALDVLVTAELERRAQAREDKNWAVADEVRDRLAAAGIDVVDAADGVSWKLQ